MLILDRKPDESFVIGDNIEIKILTSTPHNVKVGITAPRDKLILRSELIGTPPKYKRGNYGNE